LVCSIRLSEITADLLFTFQDFVEFLNDLHQLVRIFGLQCGATEVSPVLAVLFRHCANPPRCAFCTDDWVWPWWQRHPLQHEEPQTGCGAKGGAGGLADGRGTVVMPTVGHEFDKSVGSVDRARGDDRRRDSRRSAWRSSPLRILMIKA
jgi:hypothetical protein